MIQIKKQIATGNFKGALANIAEALRTDLDVNALLNVGKYLKSIPESAYKEAGFVCKKIAFLNGYSTQFLATLTRVELFRMKIYADIFESDYGLFEQLVFSEDEKLKKFAPEICYFCVGSDHLKPAFDLQVESARWLNLWEKSNHLLGCEIIQNTFEEPLQRALGNLDFKHPESLTRKVIQLNVRLSELAPSYVHFNDVNFLSGIYGRKNWRDENLYNLSKIPVAYSFMGAYSHNLASVIAAVYGKNKKCLVLDLDNTLWGGVVGDDGIEGIEIGEGSGTGEAYKIFQTYVKRLKDRGVILAVCSKNEEKNAKEPFLKRTEMVLKLDDISCFMANWSPKSENIVQIAKILNIGLDSFVFIDDNPAEREIVKKNLPEVAVIDLPEDPSLYASALSEKGYFDIVSLTQEDLNRTNQYKANAERDQVLKSSGNYSDYLKSLEMTCVIAPFNALDLPRITQLINKTNQFNLTTRRYTEAEISTFSKDPRAIHRFVKLKDKFGDNGLISVVMGIVDETQTFTIATWLMSCRVLKRGVEDFLFKKLLLDLRNENVSAIKGLYLPTPKNQMVEGFFDNLGFKLKSKNSSQSEWHFDLTDQTALAKALDRETFIRPVSSENY